MKAKLRRKIGPRAVLDSGRPLRPALVPPLRRRECRPGRFAALRSDTGRRGSGGAREGYSLSRSDGPIHSPSKGLRPDTFLPRGHCPGGPVARHRGRAGDERSGEGRGRPRAPTEPERAGFGRDGAALCGRVAPLAHPSVMPGAPSEPDDPAPTEPERAGFVRLGAAPCGAGGPASGGPVSGLPRNIRYHRGSAPRRSPFLWRRAARHVPPRGPGPGPPAKWVGWSAAGGEGEAKRSRRWNGARPMGAPQTGRRRAIIGARMGKERPARVLDECPTHRRFTSTSFHASNPGRGPPWGRGDRDRRPPGDDRDGPRPRRRGRVDRPLPGGRRRHARGRGDRPRPGAARRGTTGRADPWVRPIELAEPVHPRGLPREDDRDDDHQRHPGPPREPRRRSGARRRVREPRGDPTGRRARDPADPSRLRGDGLVRLDSGTRCSPASSPTTSAAPRATTPC